MSEGWIKLHRSIQDCTLWEDKPFDKARAWIDLLLLANHRDKKILFDGKPLVVSAGCLITSSVKLSDRWGWSRGKVDRFLKMLKDEEMIALDVTHKRTAITIVNYKKFQETQTSDSATDSTTDGQLTDKSRTTDGQLTDTNKNDKECKELKNEKNDKKNKSIRDVFFPNDELLDNAFREYVLMRKKIKKPFATDHAIDLAIKKLENLSGGDNDKAIEILNQSIEHSWLGLFELKGQKKTTNQNDWLDMWKNA